MKKLLAVLLTVLIMSGVMTVMTSAATDIEFSMKGASGVPGETVEVEVYVDKNIGTWSAQFHVCFDDRYFTLLSVENGDVFRDSEFTEGLLDNKGFYVYTALGNDATVDCTNTGLILTLTFEISRACPNGSHDITVKFPNNGDGWFFGTTENSTEFIDRTVSCKNAAQIVVSESDATAAPDDSDPDDGQENNADTQKPQGVPVTEAVTDDKGENVIDEDGNVVTEVVKDKNDNVIYFETDEEGEFVTDEIGNTVTFVEEVEKDPEDDGDNETDPDETNPDRTEATTSASVGGENVKNANAKKLILFAAIGAVVVGAVIVIVVLAKNGKKNKIDE
ncbi:MAG: hypothetical protein E7575_05400 [Ruminococcaceae bacterium]|nr:hypothetical protein [Oscillospiraceae bacterium]